MTKNDPSPHTLAGRWKPQINKMEEHMMFPTVGPLDRHSGPTTVIVLFAIYNICTARHIVYLRAMISNIADHSCIFRQGERRCAKNTNMFLFCYFHLCAPDFIFMWEKEPFSRATFFFRNRSTWVCCTLEGLLWAVPFRSIKMYGWG